MVIGIIGENCSGKSTLAKAIQKEFGAEVISGRDYLRMAKSESEAVSLFRKKLENAHKDGMAVYVISEPEQAELLPEGSFRILAYADIDTIKERFRKRMHGNLPEPVAGMLEKKHGIFDTGVYDCRYDGADGNPEEIIELLKQTVREE